MLWLHLQTIFSFRVYERLIFASRRIVVAFVVYLWLLSLLVCYLFTSGFIQRNTTIFFKNFPQVTFENGVLTAPPQPVYAVLPGSDFKIAFDASRQAPPTSQELLESNTLALIHKNTIYMPGADHVQTRTLPNTLSVSTTADFLSQHRPAFTAALRFAALASALVIIPLVMLFDFCIALTVGLFFNLLTRRLLPRRTLVRLAIFLQGPLAVLWYVRLGYNIPLFTLAQVILCIIYMQQIFNLTPEEK